MAEGGYDLAVFTVPVGPAAEHGGIGGTTDVNRNAAGTS